MKSKSQIKTFLAYNKPKSANDWNEIRLYCQRIFGPKRINYNQGFDASDGITITEFEDWMDNGFSPGDIVYNGDVISILGRCSSNKAQIQAFINPDEQLVITNTKTPTNGLKIANPEDKARLMNLLLENDKQFDIFTHQITNRYIPENWERVIMLYNNQTYLAIVREIDKYGRVILCFWQNLETKELQHDPKMYFCNLSDCTFFPIEEKDKLKLTRALMKVGKKWNERMERIQPLYLDDNNITGTHWYVNETLQVVRKEANPQMKANMLRKSAGNFFINQKDAEDFRDGILEALRCILAKPEDIPEE